ncbi:MAG: pyruvate kinase [Nanoarchaeota archaeon]|nr:hypothetical protein [Nanoarchaeota archaeon]MBU1031168.1 hypothetical protein [Nanoarchaeota archaeon]MBU1849115.1 hypothetical protein [Nanoarchaeota archaeon]
MTQTNNKQPEEQKQIGLILTVPPLARFEDIIKDPVVEAVRINTTHEVNQDLDYLLESIKEQAGLKKAWIDLKCRQLRVTDYNVEIRRGEEIHKIGLSQKIELNLPTEAIFDDGNFYANIVALENENTLIIPSSLEKKTGLQLPTRTNMGIRPGMSINITDPSLKIKGYLTKKDEAYIEASKKAGIHTFMLSYVEEESDITDFLALDPDAELIAKIESPKGIEFVKNIYPKYKDKVHLMAARGDLYVELAQPHLILKACEDIINADKDAILASRMLQSLRKPEKMPASQDIFDLYSGMLMGYYRFMTGDEVSFRKDSTMSVIGLFDAVKKIYEQVRT